MIDLQNIHIYGKRLLIKLKEFESTTTSGIILGDSAPKNENFYEVMRIGNEVTQVKVGDTIVAGARYGDKITLETDSSGQPIEYKIITEEAVIAICQWQ